MTINFDERPYINERTQATDYISELLKKAYSKNDHVAINELENIQKLLYAKRYGLVWEQHAEKVENKMKNNIPIFEEIKEKGFFTNEAKDFNFLIEGDNLHSLHLLKKTHKNSVDVIYIDPPYNTGNKDFKYNDCFVDSSDSFIHSKWLSFMERRLRLAYDILSEDGVLFVSIDNNEQAQLKLLLDSIFGDNSFVTTIHVQLSTTQGMKVRAAKGGNIVKNAEYIHVYSKSGKKNIGQQPLYDAVKYDNHYNKFLIEQTEGVFEEKNLVDVVFENKELMGELEALNMLNKQGKLTNKNISVAYEKSDLFREWVNLNKLNICRIHDTISLSDSQKESIDDENLVYAIQSATRRYLVSYSKEKDQGAQRILLSEKLNEADNFYKTFGPTSIRGDWWEGFYLDMGNVKKEGGVAFKNGKKPVRLIKQLLKLVSKKNSIIVDFFAGSGTTAQAVNELNVEDGGSRNWILATNDEVIDLTHQRLCNINEEINFNLKYLKTNFVPKAELNSVDLEEELINHIIPLIELEYRIDISNSNYAICLSEESLDKLMTLEDINSVSNLFITNSVLLTSEQELIINAKDINLIRIPDYYFKEEIYGGAEQ